MDIQASKVQLESMRQILAHELRELGVQNSDVPEDWITAQSAEAEADSNLVADHVEAYNENRATLAQLETRYNNVNRALAKIETGTYGVCEICGIGIEPDRIVANAAARTCKAHFENESELPI